MSESKSQVLAIYSTNYGLAGGFRAIIMFDITHKRRYASMYDQVICRQTDSAAL